MRMKPRMMITAEGGYYLFVMSFVFAGAVLREINLMLVLAGMMLGALIYNARTARRMTRHLTVRRRLPPSAIAGEPVTIELALGSKSRFSGLRLSDAIQRQGRDKPPLRAQASTTLAEAAARRTAVVRYRLMLARRGEYHFGPLEVCSSFPFGLIRRKVDHELPGTLVVFPRLGALTARCGAIFQSADHYTAGQRRQSYAAGDFYGLRDYRSGDSRRHIHWRTSARRGKLMVRQFERALHQDVALCVDLWQPAQATDDDRQHVEDAVSFAATLFHDLCRRDGRRVWLSIVGSGATPLEGTVSTSLEREAMTRLAHAKACSRTLDNDAGTAAFAEAPRQAIRVLVTSRGDFPRAAGWPQTTDDASHQWSPERLICVSTRDAAFGELFQIDRRTDC